MKKKCGIYQITNILDGNFYIGSSKDIGNRWRQHKTKSKRTNIGHLSYLYNAMKKHGLANFELSIIEECEIYDKDVLVEREQYYIDKLNPTYNCLRKVNRLPRLIGHKWTSERKVKYSKQRKAEVAAGINVPPSGNRGNTDFRHTEQTKSQLSKVHRELRTRFKQERGSYLTPQGLSKLKEKIKDYYTPEKRRELAFVNEEKLKAARRTQKALADAFAQKYLPIIRELQSRGLNLTEIAEHLNSAGHKPRRSQKWTIQTVSDIFARCGETSGVSRLNEAEKVRKLNADDFAKKYAPIIRDLRGDGLDLSEIATRLNSLGYKSKRGANWTYQNVGRVLKRIAHNKIVDKTR